MNEPMNEFLLEARGVSKSFSKGGREIRVLNEVNLTIHVGERLAIMGSSGAGKSTLLHVLGVLEPLSGGEIFFGPKRISLHKLGDKELSRFRNESLGFVFQFHHLLPEFSALENVMMPALIAGWPRKEAADRARELLQVVGLENRLEHRPTELSGGEQQRVAVARALVLRPKLLLADELTGNLDSKNRDRVLELLLALGEKTKTSILLVTHDEEVAKKMHRILIMKDGALLVN